MKPEKAFILAAGFGTRMRPLTETCPKPLLKISGEALIERAIKQLRNYGVRDIVVNTHYLADHFPPVLNNYDDVHLVHEPEILETGGGIKNALRHFNEEVFFVLSGDGYWIDAPGSCGLTQLSDSWKSEKMDILLSLTPVKEMTLTKGVGDYDIDKNGRLTRHKDQKGQYMFNSMRLNHPRIFDNTPDGPFNYLDLMDKAEREGRLFGVVHEGYWHHLSTPEDLAALESSLGNSEKKTHGTS